jgi:hypothetical protein
MRRSRGLGDVYKRQAWEDGQLIQYAMPHLTVSEREFLISGVTDEEWAEMMGIDLEFEE